MSNNTDWEAVTKFFNAVIEESRDPVTPEDENCLKLTVYSPQVDQTMTVTVPTRKVEDFMKNLGLFDAVVYNGTKFCDQCNGPYEGWLAEQYKGHWDTCPNRPNKGD